ncbi:MAG: Xaa-Pro peptidase family protein [Candidatus Hydrogenedentota bacterium]
MRTHPIDHQLYNKRLLKIVNNLPCLIVNPLNRYYFTGFFSSSGYLLIANRNTKLLLVDARYYEKALKEIDKSIKVILIKNPDDIYIALKRLHIKRIYLETDFLSYSFIESFKRKMRYIKILSINDKITELRSIKDRYEISQIKKAVSVAKEVYKIIRKKIRTNVKENEISAFIKIETIRKEAEPAFEPIVAFSKNTSIPHYTSSNTILKDNMAVLVDFGVKYNHYSCDITRSFWYGDKIDSFYKEIYNKVLTVKNNITAYIDDKLTFKKVYENAREMFGEYKDNFLHLLGHSIGLEVHEAPSFRSDTLIKKENVFTIEPGLYFKDKFGVRIEDTVHYDGEKIINLTSGVI